MEDVLEIVIQGDQMARDELKKIYDQRDKDEREFDEELKKRRIERIAAMEENLKLLFSSEEAKYDKMVSEIELDTIKKSNQIKDIFADNEEDWINFIVSKSVDVSYE